MIRYLESFEKTACYGCSACIAACPFDAITLEPDGEGFKYPSLDKDRCTNCGACVRACPVGNSALISPKPPTAFALQATDNDMLVKSSSGAAFAVLAFEHIRGGGWVCGCILDEQFKARHVLTNQIDDVDRMRGSKYVQSDMGDCFVRIKTLLVGGECVLFSGTPCQVAGLRAFLGKEHERLVTIDLICHGVPSQGLLDDYIAYESSSKGNLESLVFRDKQNNGWCSNGTMAWREGSKKKTRRISPYNDSYYYYYLANAVSRECCYVCPYAQTNRVSDLTIGDYWNAESAQLGFDYSKGTSAVLANTEKGMALLAALGDKASLGKASLEHVAAGNGNLVSASTRPNERDKIYAGIALEGYEATAKTYCRLKPLVPIIKGLIPKPIKRAVKRMRND